MSVRDALRLALANLREAKLRTALTMLGVSIGIASLSGMVSFGVGLEDQLVGRFTQSGMFDSITVTTMPIGRAGGAGFGMGRRGGMSGRGAGRQGSGVGRGTSGAGLPDVAAGGGPETPRVRLDDEAVAKIAALAHVKSVHPNFRVPLQVAFKEYSEMTAAAGVPMSAAGEGAFQTMTAGRFFASDDETACLISLDFAKRLTTDDPKTLIGQSLTLTYATAPASGATSATPLPSPAPAPPVPGGLAALASALQVQRVNVTCPMVGIVERESVPGLGGNAVSALMIPIATARAIDAVQVTNAQSLLRQPAEPRGYGSVTVRVTGAAHTQDVEDRIKALGFSAFSINDALQGAKRAFLVLDIVLSLIGSIALAVSSLGIMNTMVMSILERTREIGIMKAIGGSDSDIRRIFLIEASAIGALGGVAGIALGWVMGRAVNFGANLYIQNQGGTPGDLFSMPLWLIGGAIGFSIVVSLLAGSYPARRAARLDPIRALRHD